MKKTKLEPASKSKVAKVRRTQLMHALMRNNKEKKTPFSAVLGC